MGQASVGGGPGWPRHVTPALSTWSELFLLGEQQTHKWAKQGFLFLSSAPRKESDYNPSPASWSSAPPKAGCGGTPRGLPRACRDQRGRPGCLGRGRPWPLGLHSSPPGFCAGARAGVSRPGSVSFAEAPVPRLWAGNRASQLCKGRWTQTSSLATALLAGPVPAQPEAVCECPRGQAAPQSPPCPWGSSVALVLCP